MTTRTLTDNEVHGVLLNALSFAAAGYRKMAAEAEQVGEGGPEQERAGFIIKARFEEAAKDAEAMFNTIEELGTVVLTDMEGLADYAR